MTLEQGVLAVLVGTPAGAFPEGVTVLLLSGCAFILFDPIGMSAGKWEPSPPTEELLGATRSEDESGCIIIGTEFDQINLYTNLSLLNTTTCMYTTRKQYLKNGNR